jgi:outer membrane protein assembly factor BamB
VDGDRLYVVGLAGNVACLQATDGKVVWQRSFVTDFGGSSPMWSFRESPLVDGDKVICTPGAQDAMLVALDKLTGKTIWKSALPAGPSSETSAPAAPSGGGGGGGRGGFGGFSIASTVGPQMFSQADANKDQKLSRAEFTALADTWFDRLDPDKSGKVTAAQFAERFYDAVPRAENAPGAGRVCATASQPQHRTCIRYGCRYRQGRRSDPCRTEEHLHQVVRSMGCRQDRSFDRRKTPRRSECRFASSSIWRCRRRRSQFRRARWWCWWCGNSGAAYSSPIAIDFEGQRQYVQLTAKAVIGVAAADGKFLWRYDHPANGMGINISTPLYHDGRVFAASAYGAGGGVVKLSKDGNGGIKAEEVWFSRNIENHHGGVVLIDGALFGANGGNGGGYPVCLDFQTGNVLWNERDSDKRRVKKGSVAVADGRIYYRTEEGPIVLIEPSRKEYLERGRFEQPDRTRLPAWAHPVIANGKLYIRDQDTLFCYDVKAK